MRDLHDIKDLAQTCIDEMHVIGLYPQITANDFSINSRIKKSLARCWRNKKECENKYSIEISTRVLNEGVDPIALKTVIMHELCHASDITWNDNHTGKWKEWAELINNYYDLDIQRTMQTSKYNIPPRSMPSQKSYKWKCSACGKTFTKVGYRAPKWYMHPQGYTHKNCPCGRGYVMSEYYGYKLI